MTDVLVTLPQALRALFPGAPAALTVEADSVDGVMDALDARWPGMRDRLCDSRPAIRRNINVFVDGLRSGLDTPVAPGTEVHVLTSVAGG